MSKFFRALLACSFLTLGLTACGGGSTMTSNLSLNSVTVDGTPVDITKIINIKGASLLNVQTSRSANFATSANNAAGAKLFGSNISYTVTPSSTASNWTAMFNKSADGTVTTETGTTFYVQIYDPAYSTTIAILQINYTAP